MRKIRNRLRVLLFIILFTAFAGAAWLFIKSPFSGKANDGLERREFDEALHLEGTWIRPDGGYTLVIEDVKQDGSLKASYFNPREINIHKAYWKFQADRVNLFIELRDTNYPGSTYNLLYYGERDLLVGAYFQAVEKQTFQIAFIRKISDSE